MNRKLLYYNLIFPLGDFALNTKLSFYYSKIKELRKYSADEIVNWQNQQLRKLIFHAYGSTVYYKDLFDSVGLCPQDISCREDLKKLPALSKHIIINNYEKFIPTNIDKIPHKIGFTGGSTGMPLKYLLDNNSWSYSTANTLLNRENLGWYIGDKHIVLGSSSLNIASKHTLKHKIYYFLKRKIGLSGVNLSDEMCEKYLKIIEKKKIRHIYGYASAVYLLADFALRNNREILIDGCYTTSEKLSDLFRQTIKQAFNCKILDEYGANDGGITAFNYGDGLFQVGYNSIFNCSDAEQFPLLLTDLTNYAFPLINYEVGDYVSLHSNDLHVSNYNGQVFKNLLGRTSDVIYLENGCKITGPGFTVLFNNMPVEYYCLKKESTNQLICYIKRRSNYQQKHEVEIKSHIMNQIGDAHLEIKYSDEVFYTTSGKRAYFIK